MNESELKDLEPLVWQAIHGINDPEFGIPVDDLGLIYDVSVRGQSVSVVMTLTTHHCPAGEIIVGGVKSAVERVPGVSRASVAIVWDPVWCPDMLSARAREMLGWR